VELAVARGFEGWLVNVEVPASPTQVESLLVWLAYLRDRMKEKVVGGEVMW
jgi:mannosyl-glycoprotein endo-beta-N-acetylglucosaminidase